MGSLHEIICDSGEHDGEAGDIELVHADTATHKRDIFTKEMAPKGFNEKVASLLRVTNRARGGGA